MNRKQYDTAWTALKEFFNDSQGQIPLKRLLKIMRRFRGKTISTYCYILYMAGYLRRPQPGSFSKKKRIPIKLTRDMAYEIGHRSNRCPHCGGKI